MSQNPGMAPTTLDHFTFDTLRTMLSCSYWRSQPSERIARHLGIGVGAVDNAKGRNADFYRIRPSRKRAKSRHA